MPQRRRKPVRTTAVLLVGTMALAGCEAQVSGSPPTPLGPLSTMVAPLGAMAPLPEAAPDEPAGGFSGLAGRERLATDEAARAGAKIAVAALDRNTGQLTTNGNGMTMSIASVVKLFIADDLLLQVSRGETRLSPQDRESLDAMLRASDDSAAEVFWGRSGGSAIVDRVVARYGLGSTRPPGNGRWFNTTSTATDLVRYYDMLLAGTGGLPAEQTDIILSNLAASTPIAPDGMMPGGVYPQRFGIPEALFAEPVAVKQGWMCCVSADWMHLSTGVIGPGRRYVVVIGSMQPGPDDVARQTITQAVKTMFPGGRI
ncbi:MAG: class A beta-lactamase-related serine hydrolase [Actinomycetia bacterium]|nr:class A beta-lactamase-related serine hydrolase [Actinomycetes bacterium]